MAIDSKKGTLWIWDVEVNIDVSATQLAQYPHSMISGFQLPGNYYTVPGHIMQSSGNPLHII